MDKRELIKKYEKSLLRRQKSLTKKITLYKNVIEDLRKLDEPEITTEQAWEKIAEGYPDMTPQLEVSE